jgi:hypothetical protein
MSKYDAFVNFLQRRQLIFPSVICLFCTKTKAFGRKRHGREGHGMAGPGREGSGRLGPGGKGLLG